MLTAFMTRSACANDPIWFAGGRGVLWSCSPALESFPCLLYVTFTVSGEETPSAAWPSTGRKEDVCFQKKLNIPDTPPLAPSGTSKLTAVPLAPVGESKRTNQLIMFRVA